MSFRDDAVGVVFASVLVAALFFPFAILFVRRESAKEWTVPRESFVDSSSNSVADGLWKDEMGKMVGQESNVTSGTQLAQPQLEAQNGEANARETGTTRTANNWRCACDGGFLPPGMFGNMEAVLKMGSGQCYHKQL
jgi:hypothetical protein